MASVGTVRVTLTGNVKPFANAMSRVQGRLTALQRRFNAIRNTIRSVFKKAAVFAAIGFSIAMGKAVQAAIEFETQVAEIGKIIGPAMAEPVAEAVREMAQTFPVAQDELMDVAAVAARLGIRGTENLRRFTRVIGEVAIATDATAEEAANSLGRIAFATETPIDKMRELASVINELSNRLPRTFSDVQSAALRAAPAMSRLGATVPEISALAGVLASVSSSARRAGTRLRRLAQEVSDPSNIMEIGSAIGLMSTRFRELVQEDPTKVILRMAAAFRKGGKGADMLKSALGTASEQALAGLAQQLPKLSEELEVANEQFRIGTSIGNEYRIFADQTSALLEVFTNRIKKLGQDIGDEVLPGFNSLVNTLGKLLSAIRPKLLDSARKLGDAFQWMSDNMPQLIGQIGVVIETVKIAASVFKDLIAIVFNFGKAVGAGTQIALREFDLFLKNAIIDLIDNFNNTIVPFWTDKFPRIVGEGVAKALRFFKELIPEDGPFGLGGKVRDTIESFATKIEKAAQDVDIPFFEDLSIDVPDFARTQTNAFTKSAEQARVIWENAIEAIQNRGDEMFEKLGVSAERLRKKYENWRRVTERLLATGEDLITLTDEFSIMGDPIIGDALASDALKRWNEQAARAVANMGTWSEEISKAIIDQFNFVTATGQSAEALGRFGQALSNALNVADQAFPSVKDLASSLERLVQAAKASGGELADIQRRVKQFFQEVAALRAAGMLEEARKKVLTEGQDLLQELENQLDEEMFNMEKRLKQGGQRMGRALIKGLIRGVNAADLLDRLSNLMASLASRILVGELSDALGVGGAAAGGSGGGGPTRAGNSSNLSPNVTTSPSGGPSFSISSSVRGGGSSVPSGSGGGGNIRTKVDVNIQAMDAQSVANLLKGSGRRAIMDVVTEGFNRSVAARQEAFS